MRVAEISTRLVRLRPQGALTNEQLRGNQTALGKLLSNGQFKETGFGRKDTRRSTTTAVGEVGGQPVRGRVI